MKTLQNIPNVLKFDVFYENLLILSTNNHLLIEGNLFDESVQNFTIQDCIYIQKEGQLKIVDKNKNQIKIDGKFYLSHSWKSGDEFIVLKVDNSDDYYSIHNNGKIDKVSWSNSFIKNITNKYFFSLTYKIITCHIFSDGTELWRKEFTGNIHKLEIWEEKVVVVATQKNYLTSIFALKAETGEVIWEKSKMSLGFQIQGNFVYSFTTFAFICINVTSGNIEYSYNLMEKFRENNFDEVTNMTVSGEYVYFSGIHDTVISMWEITTGNLVWYYRLYPKGNVGRDIDKMFIAAGEAPKVVGNRLYQLDGSKTLHIFERE